VGWLLPVVALAGILVVTLLVTGGVFAASDRRRRLRAGRYPGPPWTGSCAATVAVDVNGSPDTARERALEALRRCSRSDVTAVDPWTWVGWSGLSWRSWGQELSVAVLALGPGTFRLQCSSRPRFATTLFDSGASRAAAAELAGAVASTRLA
jgi:hypothetical protein